MMMGGSLHLTQVCLAPNRGLFILVLNLAASHLFFFGQHKCLGIT